MARTEARIKTSIWSNEDFLALDPLGQWVYLMILSQPTLNLCGVAPYTPRRWANRAKGVTVEDVEKQVAHLAQNRFVVVDEDSEEVWVRTFTKHDGVLSTPYLIVAMTRDFEAISSPIIRHEFVTGLGAGLLADLPTRFPEAWKKGAGLLVSLSEGFRAQYMERYPEPIYEPIPHELDEPILDAIGKRFHELSPNGSPNPSGNLAHASARRAEKPSALSLKPSKNQNLHACAQDNAHPHPKTADQDKGEETTTETPGRPDPLIERWMGVVERDTPHARAEAVSMIGFLRRHVDDQRLDELIGACANESETKPRHAKYLLITARNWASRNGVTIPDWPPRP